MNKKVIAPCVVALLLSLYFISLIGGIFTTALPWAVNLFASLLWIGAIVVLISVTKERIQEIRSGEEDDLSEY